MRTAKVELEPFLEELLTTAMRAGTTVLFNFARTDSDGSPNEFFIDADMAMHLVDVIKPPIIYVSKETLDLDRLVADSIEEICGDDNPEAAKAIRAASRTLKPYDGKIGRVTAHFFVGHALQTTVEPTVWLLKFESQLEAIEEEFKDQIELLRSNEVVQISERVKILANELLAEPAFNYGRTSRAKRLLLAENMFPSESSEILREVVDAAEAQHWLIQTGYLGRR